MRVIIYILIALLAAIGVTHMLLPLFTGAIVISAGLWGFAVASVIAFCIGILLLFLVVGATALLIVALAVIWTLVAAFLFPLLLPILLPLLVVLGFISFFRRRRKEKIELP
jgi:hypothetical protein